MEILIVNDDGIYSPSLIALYNALKERFKDRVIKKFDKDEINTNKKLNTTLKEFNEGNIDVLVGTQMLSKGHDYHNVSLSVIMGLDSILNMNDFRARQRAMSLLLQVLEEQEEVERLKFIYSLKIVNFSKVL